MKIRVFLGGTCAGTKWRDNIIPELRKKDIEYFNPVVPDWTPDCQIKEELEKEICNIHLYLVTPQMRGVYSIAEIIDSVYRHLNTENKGCVIGFLGTREDWGEGMWRSLDATMNLIHKISGDSKNIKASWIDKDLGIIKLIEDVEFRN